ncbi:hypothetical protein ZWY2020_024463 [Hordeum vulgare]|nr:hypothetical protein ZWY2020_024463 [Hordeum vulgare]
MATAFNSPTSSPAAAPFHDDPFLSLADGGAPAADIHVSGSGGDDFPASLDPYAFRHDSAAAHTFGMPDSNGNGTTTAFSRLRPRPPRPFPDGGRRRQPPPRVAPGSIGWARAAKPTGCGASLSPSMTRFGITPRFNATSSAVSEAAAASSCAIHAVPRTEPVLSAEWLHANLRDPNVKIRSPRRTSLRTHAAAFPVIEKVSLEHLDPEYAFEESDVFVLRRRPR